MNTLWRHYAARFLSAFAGSLLILALIVIVVDMLLNIDEILRAHPTVFGAVTILIQRVVANYLTYLIPFATFAAAFIALGQAARWYEVVALKAGGISPIRATLPIVAISVVIALASLVINETAGVQAAGALNITQNDDEPGLGGATMRSGTIWYNAGRVLYSIRELSPDGLSVRDVRVFQRDESGRLERLIEAQSATRLSPQRWEFVDAVVRSFQPGSTTAPPKVERAARITLDLPADRSPKLRNRELAALSLPTLSAYVSSVLEAGGKADQARALLHTRLTMPVLVILFALLAIPLALSVEQTKSLAMPALQGVGILVGFMLVREYGTRFATLSGLAGAFAPWVIVGAFLLFATWRISRIPR